MFYLSLLFIIIIYIILSLEVLGAPFILIPDFLIYFKSVGMLILRILAAF